MLTSELAMSHLVYTWYTPVTVRVRGADKKYHLSGLWVTLALAVAQATWKLLIGRWLERVDRGLRGLGVCGVAGVGRWESRHGGAVWRYTTLPGVTYGTLLDRGANQRDRHDKQPQHHSIPSRHHFIFDDLGPPANAPLPNPSARIVPFSARSPVQRALPRLIS
jgi:hypothetical protein